MRVASSRRKTAEDDGVNGADTGARQHGDRRLRHHRHVDNHAVTLGDPDALQHAREAGDLIFSSA